MDNERERLDLVIHGSWPAEAMYFLRKLRISNESWDEVQARLAVLDNCIIEAMELHERGSTDLIMGALEDARKIIAKILE